MGGGGGGVTVESCRLSAVQKVTTVFIRPRALAQNCNKQRAGKCVAISIYFSLK